MENIFRAIEFASKAHHGQCRKGTCMPYIIHPMGVMQILIEYGCASDVVVAGILHDVIEDTEYSENDIAEKFGQNVLRLVKCASEPEHHSASWEERKQHTIDFLNCCSDYDVLYVCVADKLDNILSIKRDFFVIGDSFWQRFNRGYEKQKWYYQELARVLKLKSVKKGDIFDKFVQEVQLVFFK